MGVVAVQRGSRSKRQGGIAWGRIGSCWIPGDSVFRRGGYRLRLQQKEENVDRDDRKSKIFNDSLGIKYHKKAHSKHGFESVLRHSEEYEFGV
jgi:hypothetical protein